MVQALPSVTNKSSENALWGADNLWELHLGANSHLFLGMEIAFLLKWFENYVLTFLFLKSLDQTKKRLFLIQLAPN